MIVRCLVFMNISLTPEALYEQMEIFLKYHNRTAVQQGRVNGNVGRMSCEVLRTRSLWLWLRLKEETRTLLSQKKLNMEAYIQRNQIGFLSAFLFCLKTRILLKRTL